MKLTQIPRIVDMPGLPPGVVLTMEHTNDGAVELRATFRYYGITRISEEALIDRADSAVASLLAEGASAAVRSLVEGVREWLETNAAPPCLK